MSESLFKITFVGIVWCSCRMLNDKLLNINNPPGEINTGETKQITWFNVRNYFVQVDFFQQNRGKMNQYWQDIKPPIICLNLMRNDECCFQHTAGIMVAITMKNLISSITTLVHVCLYDFNAFSWNNAKMCIIPSLLFDVVRIVGEQWSFCWIQWQKISDIKRTRNYHPATSSVCKRPAGYHSTSKIHVRDWIFKLSPIHALVICQFLWIHWIQQKFCSF